MDFCAVKDRANKGPTLVSRFALHQVVSETGVSHGTSEETAGAPSSRSYWRLSGDFLLEEKGYGAELFHTYCKVGEKVCATTIDHDSSINAVGIDIVEKLQLSMTPHPRPYSLRRYYDKLDITHQTMVLFSVGKFSCVVLCDVIPVPMISCHMLLGEPWYKKNNTTYDYLANTFTVVHEKKYVLMAMEKKLFITWRKERLRKMMEQEEAKKEAEAAEFCLLHVQPADHVIDLEIDKKSRTISHEGREDDTATPVPTTVHAVGLMVQKCVVFNNDLSQATFETHKEERIKSLLYFLLRSTSAQHEEFYACMLQEDKKKMSWFERNIINIYFLFYFLPCKEYNMLVMRTNTCDLLSLKGSGWGPPGKLDVMHQLY